MPSISSRLRPHPTEPIRVFNPSRPVPPAAVNPNQPPTQNPVLRCPIPNIVTPSPDNLRQFYGGYAVPQYRFAPPSILK